MKFFLKIIFFLIIIYAQIANAIEYFLSPGQYNNLPFVLHAGDTIYLQSGEYFINLKLANNISIIGDANNQSILKPLKNELPILEKIGAGKIANLVFSDYSPAQSEQTIEIKAAISISNSDAIIENCMIINNKSIGIYASFFNGEINNSVIKNNSNDGLKIYNSNCILENNIIANNGDDGIQALQSSIKIFGNNILENADADVEFWFDNNSNIFFGNNNNFKIKTIIGNSPRIINSAEYEQLKKSEKKYNNNSNNQPATISFDNISDLSDFKEIIKYPQQLLQLREPDFSLNYFRNSADTLETVIFNKIFSNVCAAPNLIKNISDTIIINSDDLSFISKTILKQLSVIDTQPTVYKINNTTNDDLLYELNFPDYLPPDFCKSINQIYALSLKYKIMLQKILDNLSIDEKDFLYRKTLSKFFDETAILAYNIREELINSEKTDSENLKLKKIFERINAELIDCQIIAAEIIAATNKLKTLNITELPENILEQDIIFETNTILGDIIIAGKNANHHQNSNAFILIDFGGNDVYNNKIANSNITKPISIYLDFAGNDIYRSDTDFDICSAIFGVSILIDYEGTDFFSGKNNSVCANYFGVSILEDLDGNDIYETARYGLAAATLGISILLDKNGNDIYRGPAYTQAFGAARGAGILIDLSGADNYLSGADIVDSIRYNAHYITMSQGFGFGFRPYIPGGIGLLIDKSGNDVYKSDIFGQASSYWYAVGAIVDYTGDDKYISHRYAQGAGVHFAIGCLFDLSGDDEYSADEMAQGCGHDIAAGLLIDHSGNDFYKNIALGQGAAVTNGIGILLDKGGNDNYFSLRKNLGYGEYLYQREYGSIGIFYDLSGDDIYPEKHKNNDWLFKGKYGVFIDKFK